MNASKKSVIFQHYGYFYFLQWSIFTVWYCYFYFSKGSEYFYHHCILIFESLKKQNTEHKDIFDKNSFNFVKHCCRIVTKVCSEWGILHY